MRENEVLPENPHSKRMVSRPDVQPGRTVNVKQRNPIFTYRLIAPVFLTLRYFSGIRTNRRFSADLENPGFSEYSETLIDPGEF